MRRRVETRGLLVRSVAYGESDLVATFFTESDGKVSALVRGARRSSKRFAGGLEPMHVLALTLEDKGSELMRLADSRVVEMHLSLVGDLAALDAGGRALRWLRHLCPPRTPEPGAWEGIVGLLAALDAGVGESRAPEDIDLELARFGFALLAEVGYGLELDQCTRCGKTVPAERAVMVDPAAGGVVCTSCGGGAMRLSSRVRALAAAVARGEPVAASLDEARALVKLAEDVMAAHGGLDPAR
ncbi:MAG: DNA repair protein RecO [Myxococcales bacterium]|nr:DNA repair protein RecO [Myxococcales bacterium]